MAEFKIKDEDLVSLSGQVVLVTGASSGIGFATVKFLLDRGCHVIAGDVNEDMKLEHANLTFLKTDVTSWADLSALFKKAKSKHGNIDGVFANAGIGARTTYLDERLDENGDLLEPTHLVYDINLRAVVNTTALAIHYMRRQESGGSVILTASASSFQRFRTVDYTTAKHGVLGLMRGLVPILMPDIPIRVNAVAPSWTKTGLIPEGLIEKAAGIDTQPPEAVARSVALLLADKERNGQLIYSVQGKYSEAEAVLLKAAAEVVGNPSEDVVMSQVLKAVGGSGFGITTKGSA